MISSIVRNIFFSVVLTVLILSSWTSAQVLDKIVAIVDSEIITLVDLNREAAPYIKRIEAAGYSKEKYAQAKARVFENVLNNLIDKSLTQQEAKKYGLSVSGEEVDTAIENFRKTKSISQEELDAMLARDGMDLETFRESFGEKLLQNKLINHAVKSKVVITDSEIKAYYEANKTAYSGVKKYHLRNILVGDEEQIQLVYELLKQKKAFAGLAKEYSKAPNAPDGGDLGLFDIANFSEQIKDRIQPLEKGQYSQIIDTAQGFQIFYVQDIVLEGNKTLEQAREEIYGQLYQPKVEEKFKTWLNSLKEQAHIEIRL